MSDDYLWDRSGEPDRDVERLEHLLRPLAHHAPQRRKRRLAPWLVGGAAVAMTAALAIYLAIPRAPACSGGTGFAFTARGGDVSCGGGSVASGVLQVGGNLDTGAHEADVAIAAIGHAVLGPHTRVRLEETGVHHHLALDRGRLHATVNAPPRLFEVSTKHADVTDLGCEYTIEVDDAGAGSIVVDRGKVELATASGSIIVAPMGTRTAILAGERAGIPIAGTNAALADAIAAYERGEPALDRALLAAETPDAITVVALAAADPAHRREILVRLAQISPPPSSVTIETAMAGGAALDAWREDVVDAYFGLWRPGK